MTSTSSTPGCSPPTRTATAPTRRSARRVSTRSSSPRRWLRRRATRSTRSQGIDAPVVVWNPITIDRLPDALTQSQATVNSSQVAAVMLANPFVPRRPPLRDGHGLAGGRGGRVHPDADGPCGCRRLRAARRLGPARRRLDPRLPRRRVDRGGARAARRQRACGRGPRAERRLRRRRGRPRRRRSSRRSPGAAGRITRARPTSGACVWRSRSATSPRDERRRRHRQLPLRRAPLEPGDRDHGLPRRLAPHRGRASRSPARATCRRRSRS